MLKTAEKLMFGQNEVKRKMGFRAYSSKGVDKNGAKCNVEFGRKTENLPEDGLEGVNVTSVEMGESFVEKMAVEEQEAMEEC